MWGGFQVDVCAVAAATTVRGGVTPASTWAPEGEGAVTAGAAGDGDGDLVDEAEARRGAAGARGVPAEQSTEKGGGEDHEGAGAGEGDSNRSIDWISQGGWWWWWWGGG